MQSSVGVWDHSTTGARKVLGLGFGVFKQFEVSGEGVYKPETTLIIPENRNPRKLEPFLQLRPFPRLSPASPGLLRGLGGETRV